MNRISDAHLGRAALFLALLAFGSLSARAANYVVSTETELRNAIVAANADGDPSSTITLSGNITIANPSALPAATKPIAVDTATFVLSGASSGSSNGLSATFSGPQVTLNGTASGGNGVPTGGHGITFSSGTFVNNGSITGGASTGTPVAGGVIAGSGTIIINNGTMTGGTSGSALVAGGSGIVGSSNTYIINSGALVQGLNTAGGTAGFAVNFVGGGNTLELRAGWSLIGGIRFQGAGDTLALGGSADSSLNVASIGFPGSWTGIENFRKIGTSTWTLTGSTNTNTSWQILGGTLSVSSNGNLGGAAATVTFDGGTLQNTASFTSARNMTINAGGGTIQTLADLTLTGVIGGAGTLTKSGGSTLILTGTNTYGGGTTISDGTLLINGNQSGATGLTTVASGGTLGGTGIIGGSVVVADGGTLTPGSPGSAPGTLTIQQDLTLASGAILNYQFGEAGVPGGAFNDLTVVNGNLVLDGTLNVSVTPGRTFGPGVYRVINYSGSLTNNGLQLGTIPASDYFVQTSVSGQVNLVNADGMTLTYWDGNVGPKNDGAVNGGDGIWQNPTGNDNWTNVGGTLNAPWTDSAFAIFQATGGNVTVDNSLGQVRASGMQFAVDGYHLSGGAIELTGSPTSIIRVGDGTLAGAGYTATIDNVLFGTTQLVKTDLGTLVLNGINTYTGGTAIEGGAIQISSDANLGDASGALTLDGGTLWTTADIVSNRAVSLLSTGGFFTNGGTTLTLTGVLSGAGGYVKDGNGTLVLTGENTYTGLTTISAGILQIGDGGASGSIVGDVLNNSALAFNRTGSWTYGGEISGSGSVWQIGSGITVLTGANSYTGATHVGAGTLRAGATNTLSAASDHIVYGGGTLDLAGFNQTVASLANAGIVNLGGAPGTVLTIAGNYVGAGGVFNLNTTLGGDASPTDRVVVGGATSGSSLLHVTNVGGGGAATTDGIKVVDVAGASNGTFSLLGDYVFQGQQAVVGGAYAYTLQQNGVSTPTDGDWYLRSALINAPTVPIFQPGVALYESYPQILLNLISMPTLRERVGNRYLGGGGAGAVSRAAYSDDDVSYLGGPSSGAYAAPATSESGQAWWGRIDATRSSVKPSASTAGASFDADQVRLQTGFDAKLYEDGGGKLMGGLTVQHGTSWAKINSIWGDGKIDIEGYGLGATMTWYGLSGLYVDSQAQVNWFDTDMRSSLAGGLTHGDNAVGYGLSLETGKRFAAGGPWALTPQVQLAYTRADFDFTDTFGAAVAAKNGDSLLGRLGLALDYRDAWTGGRGPTHSHLYGIANLYYEFLDGTSVDVAGTKFISQRDELWGGVGVGGTYSWNADKYALFGEVSVNTSLENLGDSYSVNGTGGFRVRW